jgi:hypothetical protein
MPRAIATLPVANIEFTSSEGSPADFLYGYVRIAKRDFHVIAVRLVERKVGATLEQGLPAKASPEATAYYANILTMNEGYLATIKIPGYSGDWAVTVFPFAD